MAPLGNLQCANSRILKRPFIADIASSRLHDCPTGSSSENKWARIAVVRVESVSTRPSSTGHWRKSCSTKMPSAAGPRMYENHIPSFMSIYDMDASLIENPNLLQLPSKPPGSTYPSEQTQPLLRQSEIPAQGENERVGTLIHHQHHESTSTTSDSTDSSPTTTISTIDSASLTDPSPSSSPESPVTLVPLSAFGGSSFGMDSFQELKMNDGNPIRPPFSNERPMTSPSPRKFKNPKSLALNLHPLSPNHQPIQPLQPIPTLQTSEPASPSFIKPPPLKARKKPSLLSLNTGAANTLSLEPLASPSVPTMLQRRGLKHSISSPQILATPGFGPTGGMTLGERRPLGPSRFKELSLTTKTFTINEDHHEAPAAVHQMATRVPGVSVGGDSFDRPHTGEDAKSPSYPEGPILMHEPSVHLYSEPRADEASNFDLVINVAREVKNPFNAADAAKELPKLQFSTSEPTSSVDSIPETATSFASFKSSFEVQPSSSSESSPTTPKASLEVKRPEYVHVPWDHNTDVKDELWDLCQLIESRTKQGKKVLVHCQQGASRSATLIIAYGMYINPGMSATEAYSAAQSKSRWVNPNMSLLFSLNDFKKIIDQKRGDVDTSSTFRKPLIKHRPTLSDGISDPPPTPSRIRGNSTPNTAARDQALAGVDDSPIPTQSAIERLGSFDFGFDSSSTDLNQQQESRENAPPVYASTLLPPPHRRAPAPPTFNLDERVQPLGQEYSRPGAIEIPRLPSFRQEPSRSTITEFTRPAISNEWEDLMSPRITEMTNNPIQTFSRSFGSSVEVAPPTPSLFSPRSFEFPRSTFFPSLEHQPVPAPAKIADPRSPPTKGEAPIIRSIDDVL